MTLEEEVRKLNDYYQKHKTELAETNDDCLKCALDLLYDMYFTDSKDTTALRKIICNLIDIHARIDDLEQIAEFWRNECDDWRTMYCEQYDDDC